MNRKRKQIIGRIVVISLLAILALFVNQYNTFQDNQTSTHTTSGANVMEVHFIDVGQGDSILIEENNKTMLIDAGDNNKGNVVTDYLKSQNIEELDYVIGTHPHSDHIGGMDTVLKSVKVDKIIMSPVKNTTRAFEDVLDVIDIKGLKITKAEVGKQYSLGDANFTIVAPNSSSYGGMNDYSVVIKLVFGNTSFLFTGDAGEDSEKEMINNGIDISADVLKVGHHGSSNSCCEEFLDVVDPSYAVICVGKDNDYGHPQAEILQRLLEHNIKVYRTDEQGTVVFTSDGKTISINTQDYEITKSDLEN